MNKLLDKHASKFRKKGMRVQINLRVTDEMLHQMAELQHLLDLRTRTDAVRCAVLMALDIARKGAGK
jgi:hypothetical protein